MTLSQQFLDKEEKKNDNVYLNSSYAQLRVDIFAYLKEGPLSHYSARQVELITEDLLRVIDVNINETS